MRYLIGSEYGWLGGLGFGASAIKLGDRDQWIGWDASQQRQHLHRVIGMSRFLIRPSVRCHNLASMALEVVVAPLPLVAGGLDREVGVAGVLHGDHDLGRGQRHGTASAHMIAVFMSVPYAISSSRAL